MPRIWPFRRRTPEPTYGPTEARAITFQDLWGGSGSSFQDIWASGADTRVSSVSLDRALSLTPVYAATSLIADLISSFPVKGYRKVGDARVLVDPQPQLVTNPTEFGTTVDWVHRCVTSLALRGNAYGLITGFDKLGYPTQIEWLHPDDVTIDDNKTEGPPRWRLVGNPVNVDRIVHIPYYTVPGFVLGLSPIRAYAMAIDTGLYAHHFGRDYFRNGSIPAGILKTEQRLDDENQIDVVKARFKRNAANREPVVLGSGLDYKTISVAPNESQFLDTLKATATQIAAIYHLQPELIGGNSSGSSLTYQNVEQRSLDTVKLGLMPYISRIESAMARRLPGQQYVKFNIDAFVRPDTKTRYEAHSLALTDGWMNKDEVRALEDLPPIPDGKGGWNPPPPPTPPAAPAPAPEAAPAAADTGTSSTNGSINGRAPAAANGRARNGSTTWSGWDPLIALHGRRSDPWA